MIALKARSRAMEAAVCLYSNLHAVFPTGEYENWAACQALFALAKAVLEQRPCDDSSMADWATVLYRAAWYTDRTGNIADAEMLAKKALEAREKMLGHKHEGTVQSIAMVADAYSRGGRWDEAETLQRQVMKTLKKKLGADHPDTLTSMANLAFTWKAQCRSEEAVVLMRQCIQQRQRVLKAGHLDLTSSVRVLESWKV
jgi:hypothetical protein